MIKRDKNCDMHCNLNGSFDRASQWLNEWIPSLTFRWHSVETELTLQLDMSGITNIIIIKFIISAECQ